MVEKYNSSNQIQTNAVFSPRQSPLAAVQQSGLKEMTDTLGKWIGEMHNVLDERTVRAAKEAGAKAGFTDTLNLPEGDSLAIVAYNRAAVETFINKTTVDVSTRVSKMANDPAFKANPAGLRAALEKLEGGYLKGMPTEAHADFRLAFNSQVESAVQSAQVNQFSGQLDEARGSWVEAERAMTLNILNGARDGKTEFVDREMERYFAALERQGPLTAGGTGVLSGPEVVDRKVAMEKQVFSQSAIGGMLKLPDAEKPAYIEGLLANPATKKVLTPDEQIAFKGDVIQAFDAQTAVQDKIDSVTARAQKAEADAMETKFVLEPTEENFNALIQHPGFDGSPYTAYQHFQGSVKESNPFDYKKVEDLIMSGNATEAREALSLNRPAGVDDYRLTATDRSKLVNQLAELEQGGGFEATEQWKELNNRVKADMATNNAFGIPVLNSEGEMVRRQLYDWMRTEWPKYQRGELKEFPDVLRQYDLKKAAKQKPTDSTVSITISTGEEVVVPKKWVDNPSAYERELTNNKSGMLSRYKDPDFVKFMGQLKVEQEGARE